MFREAYWQSELLNNDVRLDIRIVKESDNRDHVSRRPSGFAWKLGDLDLDNFVLVLGDIICNQDLLGQPVIRWSDEENLAVVAQLPDYRVARSFFDAGNTPFRSARGLAEGDFHLDLVTIHGGPHQTGRYIDVALDPLNFFFRNDKAVTVAMQQDGAFDQIPDRRFEPTSTVLGELSLFNKLIEDVLDLLPCSGRGLEIFENALQIYSAVGGLLNVAKEILFIKVRLRLASASASSRLPRLHNSSLLTLIIEEHRFEFFSRNGGIGRRAR